MKATRKLIPALIMLVVAAVVMSTASYAWFSMNRTVEAVGMAVTATSDTVFLQIKGVDDAAYSELGTTTIAPALYPASHVTKTGVVDGETAVGVADLAVANVATAASWWYGYSDDPSDATLVDETAKILADLDGYVATATFTVNITAASGLASASNLKVSKVDIDATAGVEGAIADGVTIIIAGPDGLVEFKASDADGDNAVTIANSIPKDTASITITAYIYIDGENAAVMTDNATKLAGTIGFELTCDAAVYEP